MTLLHGLCLIVSMLMALSLEARGGEKRRLDAPWGWARDGKEKITLTPHAGGIDFRYTGKQDWAISGFGRIPVKPGEQFSLSLRLAPGQDKAGGFIHPGAILERKDGSVALWSYASRKVQVPSTGEIYVEIRFIIPRGISKMEPRVIGEGESSAFLRDIELVRLATVSLNPLHDVRMENNTLAVTVSGENGDFAVTDKRTGRCWAPSPLIQGKFISSIQKKSERALQVSFLNPESMGTNTASFSFTDSPREVLVEISGEGELVSPLNYPAPFDTRKGDRLIVPLNEGMGYPVEEAHQGLYRLTAYCGHGICMSFFGVAEDATGAGWMCILETSDDAAMNAFRVKEDGNWVAGPSWDGQKKQFGYTRRARYIFQEKGGHVAMAKRYRAYAKQIGKFKSFSEKVKANPNIDKLIGAANIWNWDTKDKPGLVREMQAAGIDRILWSAGGNDEEIKILSAMPKVLTSRYDIYQDIYYPEQMKKLGDNRKGLNSEAYPNDINWAGPSSNEWRRAWGVKAPDGTWTYCAMMCDARAPFYERKNVSAELKHRPYTARFIDTTVASPWQECWHPDHPMTRSDSRHWKMELLRILVDEFHLVCGSETGHDASVPFCDYYEGMLSLGPYRVPDSGRYIEQIWTNVPPMTMKYQVGEKYRLPLWELVYHECVCAHWYWGDYSNKLPDIWHKRDLFNALYGTAPMYIFTMSNWKANKARFVESYKTAQPVARATGYSEMVDHRILSPDRSVQQTVFANGVTVTVNFGESAFTLPNGKVIAGNTVLSSVLPTK